MAHIDEIARYIWAWLQFSRRTDALSKTHCIVSSRLAERRRESDRGQRRAIRDSVTSCNKDV